MIPKRAIDDLTEELRKRQQTGPLPPPVLFLGAGCTHAAGVPPLKELARQVVNLYAGEEPTVAQGAPVATSEDDPLPAFYRVLEKMSSDERFSMLQSLHGSLAVPQFYQDLALLIHSRYFRRVLTTNYDTLLERALDGAGMRPDEDYQVISLGGERRSKRMIRGWGAPDEGQAVQIVKLHGDLAREQVSITPDEVEEAVRSGQMKRLDIEGDIVMVGYEFESEPTERWLARTREERGRLWWLDPDGDPEHRERAATWALHVTALEGETAKPEVFFGQLSLRLLRLPLLASLSKPISEYEGGAAEGGAAEGDAPATLPAEDDELLLEDLRGRIRRCLNKLVKLEQSSPADERTAQAQAQIDYQKRQLTQLQDQLLQLAPIRGQLARVLASLSDSLDEAVAKAGDLLSQSTYDFLRAQTRAVTEELERERSNEYVIQGALVALITLADRLCVESAGEVVKPEIVRNLSAFMPILRAKGGA